MQGRLAQQLDTPKTGTFSCWLVGFRWGHLLLQCLNIEKNNITEISVISTFRLIGFFAAFLCVCVCMCMYVYVCRVCVCVVCVCVCVCVKIDGMKSNVKSFDISSFM